MQDKRIVLKDVWGETVRLREGGPGSGPRPGEGRQKSDADTARRLLSKLERRKRGVSASRYGIGTGKEHFLVGHSYHAMPFKVQIKGGNIFIDDKSSTLDKLKSELDEMHSDYKDSSKYFQGPGRKDTGGLMHFGNSNRQD